MYQVLFKLNGENDIRAAHLNLDNLKIIGRGTKEEAAKILVEEYYKSKKDEIKIIRSEYIKVCKVDGSIFDYFCGNGVLVNNNRLDVVWVYRIDCEEKEVKIQEHIEEGGVLCEWYSISSIFRMYHPIIGYKFDISEHGLNETQVCEFVKCEQSKHQFNEYKVSYRVRYVGENKWTKEERIMKLNKWLVDTVGLEEEVRGTFGEEGLWNKITNIEFLKIKEI